MIGSNNGRNRQAPIRKAQAIAMVAPLPIATAALPAGGEFARVGAKNHLALRARLDPLLFPILVHIDRHIGMFT
jgi:hypothetical protein